MIKVSMLILGIIVGQVGVCCGAQGRSLERNGATIISASAPGLKVSVSTMSKTVNTRDVLGDRSQMWQFPEEVNVLQEIKIVVNGRALFVPRSAFVDLIDPQEADLELKQKSSYLIIHGGDASESYFVRIEFDRERVVRRALFPGIVGTRPLQETVYHLRVLK